MATKRTTNKKTNEKAAQKKCERTQKEIFLCCEKKKKEHVSLKERFREIEPEYKAEIKEDKWEVPEFTKTGSPLYDSVTKIMSVFVGLLQWQPTRVVLRWCAHKQTFLSQLVEPIKDDLELLTSRLEEKFPNSSKKISDLIDELHEAFQEHNIHLIKGPRLYLLPPESWNDLRNYEEFLRWREQEIMWAVAEDPNIESHKDAEGIIKGLTCTYPADIIKTCAKIYKELEKPYEILLEQGEPTKTGQKIDSDNEPQVKGVQGTKVSIKSRFKFNEAQAFFDDKDLELPAGETVSILKRLLDSFGEVVKHNELDQNSNPSNASDILKGRIHTIKIAMKRQKIPYEIESKRGVGYVLQ